MDRSQHDAIVSSCETLGRLAGHFLVGFADRMSITLDLTDDTGNERLSLTQAAQLLKVSLSTVRRLIDKGDLPTQRLEGRVFVTTSDINQYLDSSVKG